MGSEESGESIMSVGIPLLSGVAGLAGLILALHVIMRLVDKWGCLSCCFSTIETNRPRYVEGSGVAKEAKLSGMTTEERRAVLEKILISKAFKKDMLMRDSLTGDGGHDDDHLDSEDCCVVVVSGRKHLDPSSNTSVTDETDTDETASLESSISSMGARSQPEDTQAPKKDEKLDPEHSTCREIEDMEEGLDRTQSGANSADDLDHDTTCAICITEYEEGELVTTGNSCSHKFHKDCLLEWLDKHDVCPYCRENMITKEQMQEAAMSELGEERMKELTTACDSSDAPRNDAPRNNGDASREARVVPVGLATQSPNWWYFESNPDQANP